MKAATFRPRYTVSPKRDSPVVPSGSAFVMMLLMLTQSECSLRTHQ